MDDKQQSTFHNLKKIQGEQRDEWLKYWMEFSNVDTWQFWVLLALFILPLIFLLIFIDKNRPLLLGFYGYNVHVFFTYIDAMGTSEGFWGYPYKMLPLLPSSFTLDVSLIPVIYMFVYQWVLNRNKNYYLYLILTSAVLAFIFKPLFVYLQLFELNKGANYFHLFLGYLIVGLVSKFVTNLFLYLEKKGKHTT